MGRDLFDQLRVLRAPCSVALNSARERTATTSLGNLGQDLTTLMVKNFFLISNLNLPCFSLKPSPFVLSLQALVQGQVGWSSEQRGLVEDVPADGRGVGTR